MTWYDITGCNVTFMNKIKRKPPGNDRDEKEESR